MRHDPSYLQYWVDEILKEKDRSVKWNCVIIVLNNQFKDMISDKIWGYYTVT